METGNFGMGGFFAGRHFGHMHKDLRVKWSKMTEEEKKSFVEDQVNFMNEHFSEDNEFFFRKAKLTVEDMDKRYEAWQKKSDEEKAEFVDKRNKKMEHIYKLRNYAHHRCCF